LIWISLLHNIVTRVRNNCTVPLFSVVQIVMELERFG
jgi:hypothetical protein